MDEQRSCEQATRLVIGRLAMSKHDNKTLGYDIIQVMHAFLCAIVTLIDLSYRG